MMARPENNLPAVAHDGAARCLLAIEMSKQSWVIAAIAPLPDKISRHTLKSRSLNGLLELVGRLRAQISHATSQVVEVISCYEASYDGFWLHRSLEERGVRNHVIDPASLQVNRRARGAKTDRIDAECLLRSLMIYLRGEPKVWSVVRVPSVAEEDARRLHRERDRLIEEPVQHVNRIERWPSQSGIAPPAEYRTRRLLLETGDRFVADGTFDTARKGLADP
jgi:transposase